MNAVMYRGIGQIAVEQIEKPVMSAKDYKMFIRCKFFSFTLIKYTSLGRHINNVWFFFTADTLISIVYWLWLHNHSTPCTIGVVVHTSVLIR